MSPVEQTEKFWVGTFRDPRGKGFATLKEAYDFAKFAQNDGHVALDVFQKNEDGEFTSINEDGSTTE